MVRIKPVARHSLVDTVVEQVRKLIERGKFAAGARLPSESELGERLQVSRTVLREAIGRLEAMGMISVQRGRGMFVGDPRSLSNCVTLVRSAMAISPKEMAQFAEFRSAIECYAARKAAERATPADLAELESLLEKMDDTSRDYLETIHFDFQFHLKLIEMTGNSLMRNVMDVVQQFVLAGMVKTTPQPRNHRRSQLLHRAIFDAVRDHNPDAAEQAMQQHMERVAEALQRS